MSTKSRLDKLYKAAPRIRLPEDCKILWISDLHIGDGGPEDDFRKNAGLFDSTINEYLNQGYVIYGLGDLYDLWETKNPIPCPLLMNINKIKGNHDNSLSYPEAIVLQIGNLEIFCCHGMQGDWVNDNGQWVGKLFVKWVWVPLQWIGWHDVQLSKKKRHERQEKRLCEWANKQIFPSMFGHTHLLADIGKYKNAGSWVQMGGEAIEFSNGKFTDKHF